MSNWTRAHDAWIARECEGLAVEYRISGVGQSGPVDWCFLSPMPFTPHGGEPQEVWVPVKHYLTDPAAAIRAAEAWQLKDVDQRRVEICWVGKEKRVNLTDYKQIREGGDGEYYAYRGTVEAALAQALYRATGGTA